MERQARTAKRINNEFYDNLGVDWYHGLDHPVALLRAENRFRAPWIAQKLPFPSNILDIGCGAGLISNPLAKSGHQVTGIDLSEQSLATARMFDETGKVRYIRANAYSLPFADGEFDAVMAMDVLEHVEEPVLLIAEAARVLKPKGRFFFHTFNRNWLSYLLIIKGVEWCVRNTPKNMHVYPLFIKPDELKELCGDYHLDVEELIGFRPAFGRPLWKMVFTRRVPLDFSFRFCRSLSTGYCGYAIKREQVK